jgi:hypothetical protein
VPGHPRQRRVGHVERGGGQTQERVTQRVHRQALVQAAQLGGVLRLLQRATNVPLGDGSTRAVPKTKSAGRTFGLASRHSLNSRRRRGNSVTSPQRATVHEQVGCPPLSTAAVSRRFSKPVSPA